MSQAKNGDTVKVHYTGKLDDGTVFDTSVGRDPLIFMLGTGQLIPGFEEAIIGMSSGDNKTILIPSDKAYGPHRKEMVVAVAKNQFPEDIKLNLGEQLELTQSDDKVIIVTILEISDSAVTLDANHPLAGKDLTFDVQLVEIT